MNIFQKLSICLLILGCAQINRDSREHYFSKYEMPHGLIKVKSSGQVDGQKKFSYIDQNLADRGQKLYKINCQSCHGKMGAGDGEMAHNLSSRPANLVQLAKEMGDFQFYINFSKAKGSMPGWKNPFSKKELNEISHYIKKLALDK